MAGGPRPTLADRDELAEALATRRPELRIAAAIAQSDHVVDILRAVPSHDRDALGGWTAMAGHIEGNREQWGVEPERLTERPVTCARANLGRPCLSG